MNQLAMCKSWRHLLLHSPKPFGGVSGRVVHYLICAQPPDETLSVVGAGNGNVGAPGFKQLLAESGNSWAAKITQLWVNESNTRTLVRAPPTYLNGKCSDASWTSGDQNSKRRRKPQASGGSFNYCDSFQSWQEDQKSQGEQKKKTGSVRNGGC